ncbi:MAG TPA: hypothetical protein GXX51_12545 [Firmicutes bacterium]|nr:hypothetical protein [Bacillota bacterium]
MNLENVVGVARGYKRVKGMRSGDECIVVLVTKKLPNLEVKPGHLVPPEIDGIPTDVIEVGDIRFLFVGRTDKVRPAQPGVSIAHYRVTAGTFGALVRDKRTGQPLILSNNHVLANSTDGMDGRAKIGDPVLQPGPYDGGIVDRDQVATLERFVPVYRATGPSTCPIAQLFEKVLNYRVAQLRPSYSIKLFKATGKTNLVDAALAKPLSDDLVIPDILEVGRVAGVKEAELGMYVKKSGRTTGLNDSQVQAMDAVIRVGYSDQTFAQFEGQILTGPMAQGGDSGSLVLDAENYAVGLLFAGSDQVTVCNRIQDVLRLLEVEFF